VVRRNAAAAGLADVVVVNTCAVTAEAVRQARQAIRKARRERPGARIVVTGCAAQTEPETFAAMDEVDRVLGNEEKLSRAAWSALDAAPRVSVDDIMTVRHAALHRIDGIEGHTRAFLQVQNGCDHRCTFCVIPFGRGNSRSVPIDDVVAQARRLVDAGRREIVLTGVDITSYGLDLPGTLRLGGLVRHILCHVPELRRLRLSSIDQVEADPDLLHAIAEDPRLMPHFHLSLQSGDDVILKRMKRRHARADAVRFCAEVRRLRPDAVFGADLIAGFPTETEEMFANTVRLIDDCGLTFLHVFPYSRRSGTPASRMPQVAGAAIKERAAALRRKGLVALAQYLDAQVGREAELLMERPGVGRTPGFAEVVTDPASEAGDLVNVRVTGSDGSRLRGERLGTKCAP
jgi:threonylcarbamoyladenosine tRNA methylthiotransferase MtaB